MRRITAVALLALVCTTPALALRPKGQPKPPPASRPVPVTVDPAAEQFRQIEGTKATLAKLPDGGLVRRSELFRVHIAQEKVEVEILAAGRREGQMRVKMDGSDLPWIMNYSPLKTPTEHLLLHRYDLDAVKAGGVWSAYVAMGTDNVVIGAYSAQPDGAMVTFTIRAQNVQFNLWRRKPVVNETTATIREAFRKHPEEFDRYVRPMYRELLGLDPLEVRPADVYRAFPQIVPDAKTTAAFAEVLARLDAPAAADRDKAAEDLVKLAPGSVLAAMRYDRSKFTPEQRIRVEAFIASYDDRRHETAEDYLKDAQFLIDCLELDDPTVRQAALAALPAAIGKPVEFDINAAKSARIAAADKLRQLIPPPAPKPIEPRKRDDAGK